MPAARPSAYDVMNRWLTDCACRVDLDLPPFMPAGLAMVLIAPLTISARTIRMALVNQIESLRRE